MTTKQYQKYKEAERYFESMLNILHNNFFSGTADPDFFFKRAKLFLKLIGQPDTSYKIIHVAGTSGKGSTVNSVANILMAAGYKVGVHVSPFISTATEKIQVNKKFISAQEFIDLVEELKPSIKKVYEKMGPPSFFECWMMASLLYFKKKKVDYVVLETGCGGRYDASNAVKKTEYSVITNIGLDHTHILGETIAKITYAKAGIIRRGSTVITSAKRPEALKVIKRVAKQKNAKLEIIKTKDKPNKELAEAVARKMGIDESAISKGLQQTKLPARMEIVAHKPLTIIDGAHNHDKVAYLVKHIKRLIPDYKQRQFHVICALVDPKKPGEVFAALKKLPIRIYATRYTIPMRKAVPPKKIKQSFRNVASDYFLDPQQALKAAQKAAKANDVILITGSFFSMCGFER